MLDIALLTAKLGGIAITTELLCLAIKHKSKQQKKATGELKTYRELSQICGTDGLRLSKNIKLREKFDYEGICIIAPTGSGKTSSYFYPNLLDSNIKGSIVVIDPKGELYRDTSCFQREICGRRVLKFSPLEPAESEYYNLLEQCVDATEVCQLASTLLLNGALSVELSSGKQTGGVEWIQMAEPLLSSALLFVRELQEPFNTIEYAFKTIINSSQEELDSILGNCENEDVVTQYNIFKTVATSQNTSGSIKVTLASNLKLFTDRNINLISSKTTFTGKELRETPTVLYITYPEQKCNYLAPFIAPFFSQLITKLVDSYNYKSEPIHLLFDEFGNIGMINNMSVNCATVRSRKISFSICLQSITQLYQVYGRDNAKAILNNLKTKIVLCGLSDVDTLAYIETLVGKTEINSISNSNKTESTVVRNVLHEDEIRRLEDDKILIIMSNKQPVVDTQYIYYKNKDCISKIKKVNEAPKTILKYKNYSSDFAELLKTKCSIREIDRTKNSKLITELFK